MKRTQKATHRFLKLSLLILGVLIMTAVPLLGKTRQASALTGNDFSAGHIIDDFVFTNNSSMTVQDIQNFLNAKVPICDTYGTSPTSHPNGAGGYYTRAQWGAVYDSSNNTTIAAIPYVCLKDYVENPSTKQNNLQNPGAQITGGQTAAQIIYNASQTYRINPQVILTTLQKEQGLITDDWPWTNQYSAAMGYACPDDGTGCHGQYAGFFTQVDSAAWQFRYDLDHSGSRNYVPGQYNYIGYYPCASGTTVFIQNPATAVLYNYTPYQPSPKVLQYTNATGSSNGPGAVPSSVNDGCSTYGNRNFWWYFNTWFGSTYGGLVSAPNWGVYKLENGTKRGFPNEETFLSYGYRWSDITPITTVAISSITNGATMPYNDHYRDWQLVKTSGSTGVYLVYQGTKRGFPNEETFLSQGYKWSSLVTISNTEMSLIPDGAAMPYNPHYRDGQRIKTSWSTGVYLVDNGTKRGFPNEATYLSYGYKWDDINSVSSTELGLIPVGAPMPPNPNQ